MNIPDVELLDQNGRKIHFYTDLVKGQTVVINFIFTTCTTICPPLGATFARVQKELGDKTRSLDFHQRRSGDRHARTAESVGREVSCR